MRMSLYSDPKSMSILLGVDLLYAALVGLKLLIKYIYVDDIDVDKFKELFFTGVKATGTLFISFYLLVLLGQVFSDIVGGTVKVEKRTNNIITPEKKTKSRQNKKIRTANYWKKVNEFKESRSGGKMNESCDNNVIKTEEKLNVLEDVTEIRELQFEDLSKSEKDILSIYQDKYNDMIKDINSIPQSEPSESEESQSDTYMSDLDESLVSNFASLCWNCSETEVHLFKCSGCRKARYCSKDCIVADWEVHGTYCLKVSNKRIQKKLSKLAKNVDLCA